MSREFPLVGSMLYGTPLAITPEKLAEIEMLFRARVRDGHGNLDYTAGPHRPAATATRPTSCPATLPS